MLRIMKVWALVQEDDGEAGWVVTEAHDGRPWEGVLIGEAVRLIPGWSEEQHTGTYDLKGPPEFERYQQKGCVIIGGVPVCS